MFFCYVIFIFDVGSVLRKKFKPLNLYVCHEVVI